MLPFMKHPPIVLFLALITASVFAQQGSPSPVAASAVSSTNANASVSSGKEKSTDPNSQNLEPDRKDARASKPLNPGLVQVPDVPGLPRVLIIGDSISMGYTPFVRTKLEGKANIHHPPQNCGNTQRPLDKADRRTQTGPSNLEKWLGADHWDVILFNFGLHDLKYTDGNGKYIGPSEGGIRDTPPDLYGKKLQEIATQLKKTDAKVVFVTTTPVPPGCQGRVAGDEKVYNEVALGVVKQLDIPVADLCGFVTEKQKALPPRPASEAPKPGDRRVGPRPGEMQLPFNVHFTPEGCDQQADFIVTTIQKYLPSAPAK
ncbi:MAG: SGNH/GDSL hydrolase family protein [Proteobacteria bacterium]|jgi:acyl-CoA thioesterase-1|nr:SGNH/GDSL hydrolase family protein [Pseudomonadota bacterium]